MNPGHERDLLRRICDLGDHGAFETLFTSYRRQLLYFIIGKGIAYDDAEDILQETAMQLFKYLRKDPPTAFLPIALRTAKWKIGDYRRGACDAGMTLEDLEKKNLEPPDDLDVEKSTTALATCLEILERSGMSDVQREALLLHYYVGCTVSEIAAFAVISEDGAKARIRLAMKKIKAYLRRHDYHRSQP